MGETPQRGRVTGEELHGPFRNLAVVTDIRIQEVASAAYHVTHARLVNVLQGTEGGGDGMGGLGLKPYQKTNQKKRFRTSAR